MAAHRGIENLTNLREPHFSVYCGCPKSIHFVRQRLTVDREIVGQIVSNFLNNIILRAEINQPSDKQTDSIAFSSVVAGKTMHYFVA